MHCIVALLGVMIPVGDDWQRMASIVPRQMGVCRAERPPLINGRLDDPAWLSVPFSDDFVDIEGFDRPTPQYRTRVKLLWDDRFLYVAADLEEPNVWATLTEHDAAMFRDNAFEWFLDPDGDGHWYFEFEINANNAYWDLLMPRPYKNGGKGRNDWEIPWLQTAVAVRGSLNRADDRDDGWSIEMAVPWAAFVEHAGCRCPPQAGDRWRFTAARVQWNVNVVERQIRKRPNTKPRHSSWTPQGVVDLHRPERYGWIHFLPNAKAPTHFEPDPTNAIRDRLFDVHYRQRDFRSKNGRWARMESELPPTNATGRLNVQIGPVAISAVGEKYRATAIMKDGNSATIRWTIDEAARILRETAESTQQKTTRDAPPKQPRPK